MKNKLVLEEKRHITSEYKLVIKGGYSIYKGKKRIIRIFESNFPQNEKPSLRIRKLGRQVDLTLKLPKDFSGTLWKFHQKST